MAAPQTLPSLSRWGIGAGRRMIRSGDAGVWVAARGSTHLAFHSRLLAVDLSRIFVWSQSSPGGVAEVAVAGPFGVGDLADEVGADPDGVARLGSGGGVGKGLASCRS